MLVRADAIPVVEMIKAAEAVDVEAAALWLHLGLWDTLDELIDTYRPEIDAVWKSVVGAKSDQARRLLVRQAVERRVEGDSIDDVVKAAAGLSLVRGYVAKADEHRSEEEYNASPEGKLHPKGERGLFVSRTRKPQGPEGTAYDALQSLTSRQDHMGRAAEGVATQLNDRANAPYAQMRVAGNALVASGHPKAMAAGGVVRIAAEVGPSAEDVLGSHLRRVAYRYRGTEKRPDRQLVRETKEAQAYVGGLNTTARTDEERRYQANLASQLEQRKPGEWGKGAVAYRMAQAQAPGQHLSEDQIEMRATGDISSAYLMRQLPSQDEALLSQEAGRTPPSVGVMIDRDGDVVSEAMGYQGDHYVPFDLKNLKRLQGGSYVRTRALGGPTSEDIYTGLLTGARQVQVVSRSGVFTLEFDPDLRGGRRYSDKARQMIDRYSRLLDVVDSGERTNDKGEKETFYTQDIPEDQKRELMRAALEASDYDEEEARTRFNRRLKQERAKAKLGYTEDDLDQQVTDQLREWVNNRTKAGQAPGRSEIGRAREQIREEVRASAQEQRQQTSVQRLRLNAEGYYRAMQSLRREFPYYIRDVSYESLPDFEERRRTRQPDEAALSFGAPGAAAHRTHVKRRELVPAEQDKVYGRRRKAEAAEGDGDGEGGTGGAARDRDKTSTTSSSFADLLKNERFQDQLASAAAVLKVANQLVGDPATEVVRELPVPPEGRPMDRTYASMLNTDEEFVKWLVSPANSVTHGKETDIARFITEEATPEELTRVSQGLENISSTQTFAGQFSNDRINKFREMVDAISRARAPYGEAKDDKALYEPSREHPKPYPFPAIVAAANESEEKFDKVRRALSADDLKMDQTLEWVQSRSDKAVAADIRQSVLGFNAAVRWGKARTDARSKGEPTPERFADVDSSVTPADADEWAAAPTTSPAYRELLRKQQAWAWVYTKRLRDAMRTVTGGGADPKVERPAIEGTKSARLVTSSRPVTWHSPDDPLSQVLAKRLRQRRV